jgi:hypothetical protein
VFTTMQVIYGNFWRAQFKEDRAAERGQVVWLRAIQSAGLTPDEVKRALSHCKTEVAVLPNLPGFIAITRSLRGTPAMRHVGDQARALPKGTWSERQTKARAELSRLRGLLDE